MNRLYQPTNSIAIIANGFVSETPQNAVFLNSFSSIIAVDGGLNYCFRMNLKPKLLIGDLDSVSQEALSYYSTIPTKKFPHDKDESDLEIALRLAKDLHENKPLVIFGAFGTRGDHSLYNLHLLERNPNRIFLESDSETWFSTEHSITIPCKQNQTISLMTLNGFPQNVATRGLKWELQDAKFPYNLMSLSNICLDDKVEISLSKGILLGCLIHPS